MKHGGASSTRRVVILSRPDSFLLALCRLLAARGLVVDALLVYGGKTVTRGAGRTILRQLLSNVRAWVTALRTSRTPECRSAARRVRIAGPLNGTGMKRLLTRLQPHVVVLGRSGILSPDVLAIPREGVLNVHPGLLPWLRGSSPVAHGFDRGVPLGCTAYRVDAGIDTGAILERRLVQVEEVETVEGLRVRLHDDWLSMTADLVERAMERPLPPGRPQVQRFPLCPRLPDARALETIRSAVAAGCHRELLARWRGLADRDLVLRTHADLDAPVRL